VQREPRHVGLRRRHARLVEENVRIVLRQRARLVEGLLRELQVSVAHRPFAVGDEPLRARIELHRRRVRAGRQ